CALHARAGAAAPALTAAVVCWTPWPALRFPSRFPSASRRSVTSSSSSRTIFAPAQLTTRVADLEDEMGAPGFWDDPESAARLGTEHARPQRPLEGFPSVEAYAGALAA